MMHTIGDPMAPNYNRSALVRWTNGRREWLPLSDADKRREFDKAMRTGCFADVEQFADEVRSGVLPREVPARYVVRPDDIQTLRWRVWDTHDERWAQCSPYMHPDLAQEIADGLNAGE